MLCKLYKKKIVSNNKYYCGKIYLYTNSFYTSEKTVFKGYSQTFPLYPQNINAHIVENLELSTIKAAYVKTL